MDSFLRMQSKLGQPVVVRGGLGNLHNHFNYLRLMKSLIQMLNCLKENSTVFLAPLSRRLRGAYSMGSLCRPSVVRPHFQTTSPLKPLSQIQPNFRCSIQALGERKMAKMVLIQNSRWPPCPIYGKNPSKIFFSRTTRRIRLIFCRKHMGHLILYKIAEIVPVGS